MPFSFGQVIWIAIIAVIALIAWRQVGRMLGMGKQGSASS
jgi:hypothetical protein